MPIPGDYKFDASEKHIPAIGEMIKSILPISPIMPSVSMPTADVSLQRKVCLKPKQPRS